jgi:hypothetical protein
MARWLIFGGFSAVQNDFTIWLFNIAMENDPWKVTLWGFSMAMLNDQMV